MYKSYKLRIYPTIEQKEKIEQIFGVCRLVYNLGLQIKIEAWRSHQKRVSVFDLIYQLVDLKKDYKWIKEVDSKALISSLMTLEDAYRRFFNGNGFPNYKSKRSKKSYTTRGHISIDFDRKSIKLPNLTPITFRDKTTFVGKIKTVTVSRCSSGKYFASVLVDTMVDSPTLNLINPDKTIGIDMGIKDFIILSSGEKIGNPRYLKASIGKLKILQRRASKKRKWSRNRKKANVKIAITHEKIVNQRSDFIHKLTSRLVNDNQVTTYCIEGLSVINMMRNHNLAQSITDASWSEFKRQMEYKCDWSGKNLIKIGRFEPSTKTCSVCGDVNQTITLANREWACVNCGVTHDRDINAAINIKNIGLEIARRGTPGVSVERRTLVRARKQKDRKIIPEDYSKS